MVVCAIAWGALGVSAFQPAGSAMPLPVHLYLLIMLATVTICAVVINGAARIVRVIQAVGTDGYAMGYVDGVAGRPDVPR